MIPQIIAIIWMGFQIGLSIRKEAADYASDKPGSGAKLFTTIVAGLLFYGAVSFVLYLGGFFDVFFK